MTFQAEYLRIKVESQGFVVEPRIDTATLNKLKMQIAVRYICN